MFWILKIILTSIMILGASASVAQTIDFEGIAPSGDADGPFMVDSFYFEDGFTLFGTEAENAIFDSAISPVDVNTNGTDIFGWCGDCGVIQQIVLFAGYADPEVPFNLLSFQATDLLFPDELGTHTGGDLVITGETIYGDPVEEIFDLSDAWATYTLPSTFTDLEYVIFNTTDVDVRSLGIDNIVVEAVPVPAAAWLFGSGLIGLIGIARRKKS